MVDRSSHFSRRLRRAVICTGMVAAVLSWQQARPVEAGEEPPVAVAGVEIRVTKHVAPFNTPSWSTTFTVNGVQLPATKANPTATFPVVVPLPPPLNSITIIEAALPAGWLAGQYS